MTCLHAAMFTINSPWAFIAVLACVIAAVLFAVYVEGRGQ